MCTEPLQLIPRERWGELKTVAQSDWPRSISILTLLETEEDILKHGIEYGFKVYCPNGNVNNGIVALNVKNSLYEVIILCPHDDTSELEKSLRKTALIDWSKTMEVPFAPKNVADCVKRITNEKKLKLDHCTKTQTYLLDKDSPLFDVSLAPDLTFELLSLDYVDITNTTWPHKFPGSEWYFELLIKAKLGYGLFKAGELVAWSFIKEMGALGHLYTLENHRRKGYGELVLKLISNVLLKEKKYVYAFCVAGNTKASVVGHVEWLNFVRC
ncbi:unnamed protein product [Euphydryas editha]|uniref:GCN5-related N-acetyltransferase Rv2170-like domain-containing protein n=1 Tax=Euphydryas editha TaxID=104508 RepID=A0AAU9TP49_EUPED|nr:unnamed protein product [Euphydryas editha]